MSEWKFKIWRIGILKYPTRSPVCIDMSSTQYTEWKIIFRRIGIKLGTYKHNGKFWESVK